MTEKELHKIIDRYIEGQGTYKEKKWLDALFAAHTDPNTWAPLDDSEKQKIEASILASLQVLIHDDKSALSRKRSSLLIKVAASVIFLLGLGTVYYLNQTEPEIIYLTKRTGPAQKVTLTLNDGTKVRLNSESTLRYPEVFSDEIRAVELTGEAFFEVKKHPESPFVITSYDLQTRVLGTSLDVNAYDTLSIVVSLVSGKVAVNALDHGQQLADAIKYLNPGESAVYNGLTGDILVGPYDLKETTSWKDGIIYFSRENYEGVFEKLELWYGVEFEYVNAPSQEWDYSGEFKEMSLELVLNSIGYASGFEYQIDGARVKIKFNRQNDEVPMEQ